MELVRWLFSECRVRKNEQNVTHSRRNEIPLTEVKYTLSLE